MTKLTRRSFLASVAATAVVVTMPAALSHIPKGRWVRCVQTLPGGYIGSIHLFSEKLSDDDLMSLTGEGFSPPSGAVPTIFLEGENPLVKFTQHGETFTCDLKPNAAGDQEFTILYAQVEKKPYVSSYIQTQGKPVTRPATSCSVSREDMDRCGGVADFETIPFTGGAYRDYDQDGEFLGVFVEEASSNLCLYSEIIIPGKKS